MEQMWHAIMAKRAGKSVEELEKIAGTERFEESFLDIEQEDVN
ncbi:MAG: hypothetical protein N3D14_00115 [Aquificaceae bacterium]|nr:hypothetical protein [Aquificaceae bacterium]